jgi:hypothetical protein
MRSGFYRTAAGDLSAEFVRRNGAGIRRYFAIRLRDVALATQAFEMLREAVDAAHREDLKKPPGPRAHLYRLARNIVAFYRMMDESVESRSFQSVPWDMTPSDRPQGYGKALDLIRQTVAEDDLELIELKHVHALRDEEVAHVVELPTERVVERLSSTGAWLHMLAKDEVRGALPADATFFDDLFHVLPPPIAVSQESAHVEPPKLSAGTIIGERYEIESCVGGGAFAFVYVARDVKVPSHVVALKLLHRAAQTPAAREGALAELALLASAFHPSLVYFKDHGWFDDRLWFVMPWYEGETLQARIDREALAVDEVKSIFVPIARAVAALHGAGIRHQDIKPENIFLARLKDGAEGTLHPVLLDLGAASQTGDMLVAGTPMYFAPEVAKRFTSEDAADPMTPKADVFALALSILHSIEPPPPSALESLDLDVFVKDRATKAPDVPNDPAHAPLRAFFARALAFDPAERPTAGELAVELETLGAAPKRKPRMPTYAPLSPRAWLVAGALALTTVGVAIGMYDVHTTAKRVDRTPGASPLEARIRSAEMRARELERSLEEMRQARPASPVPPQTP